MIGTKYKALIFKYHLVQQRLRYGTAKINQEIHKNGFSLT